MKSETGKRITAIDGLNNPDVALHIIYVFSYLFILPVSFMKVWSTLGPVGWLGVEPCILLNSAVADCGCVNSPRLFSKSLDTRASPEV